MGDDAEHRSTQSGALAKQFEDDQRHASAYKRVRDDPDDGTRLSVGHASMTVLVQPQGSRLKVEP